MKRMMFYFFIIALGLVCAACAPKSEPTPAPTAAPTIKPDLATIARDYPRAIFKFIYGLTYPQ